MNDDYELIKRGKNPDNEALYCVCTYCGCEFSTKKKHFIPSQIQRDAVSESMYTRCPECERFCIGMTYKHYKKFVSIMVGGKGNG